MSNKILIVEDESIEAMGIQLSLESMGYTVSGVAASREEALKKVDQFEPDLVLIGYCFEGRDGWD